MKKTLLLLMTIPIIGFGQEIELKEGLSEPFISVDQMPTLGNCKDEECTQREIVRFVSRNFKYPEIAKANGVEGRVVLEFVVEKDGSVGRVKILRGVDKYIDKAAVETIEKLPRFNPGKRLTKEEEPVAVKYIIPIKCSLGNTVIQNNTKFSKTITTTDLEKHLKILASDSLEGRETGKKGQKMAADYIMNHFKNIGIPPYKKNTYYQKFKVENSRHTCKCDDCDTDFLKKILKQDKYIKGENVLGYIEGTDLKEELIIITAHYDHLGKHEEKIYNGADDDGSGTAAALEIAEAFMLAKKEGSGPRRSVLIMTVSGEEKGLLGSKFYTDNPIYPLEKTVANLNIDMIGRIDDWHDNGNYVYLIGSDMLSQELHDISEQVNNQYVGLDLDYTFNAEDDPNRYYYRSDHYNFAKNNIPVIFYFNGIHEDYHKVTDDIEKIDFEKTQTITRLVFLTAWELANRDERIIVDKIKN